MIRSGTLEEQAERRPPAPARSRPLLRQKKFVAGGFIVLLAVGYLIFNSMQGAMMYYLTVSELMGKGSAAYDQPVRLAGKVLEGSVQQDSKSMTLRFIATDEAKQVPVVYKGVVPDAFKPGGDVVLEGKLTPGGVFEAKTLLAKCPSKYSPGN